MLKFVRIMRTGKRSRILELDGVRGIAILLVIGCHYEVFSRQLWTLPRFGWIGVDIFFVLSGFLITSVLLKLKGEKTAFRIFYARRARRILPAYILFLVLLFAASILFHDYAVFTTHSIVGKLLFLQSFTTPPIFHIHQAFTPIPQIKNGISGDISHSQSVLWSLSIEEYFYLVWAPAVLWIRRKWLIVLAITICVGEILIRWFGFVGLSTYFSIFHRFDALIYGAIVALLLTSNASKVRLLAGFTVSLIASAFLLGTIVFSLAPFVGKELRVNRGFDTFGILAFSILIASGIGLTILSSGSKWFGYLRFSPLRFIGQISYMLYLLHTFVYLIFLHFFPPTWMITLSALGVSVTLCWLSWRYLEQPILDGKYRLPELFDGRLNRMASTDIVTTHADMN